MKKRDQKAQEKINLNNNDLIINPKIGVVDIQQAPNLNLAVFNFGGGSFKPKDHSEGTLQSIKRLRKHSLEMMESQNNHTLERGGDFLSRHVMMNSGGGRPNLTPSNLAALNSSHQVADLLQNPLSDDRCSITNHPLV